MEFHGTDIRWSFNRKSYEGLSMPPENERRKNRIKKILKYVDGIILHDEELRKHLPDTTVPVYIVPLRVNLDKITPVYPEDEVKKPTVVHAPSNRGNKGTEHVLNILKSLEDKVDFILVEHKTQKEAFEIYRKADIIVDQLLAGTYGVFSIEAMALGKAVLTYVSGEMLQTFPEELPIVSSDKNTLKQNLEDLICETEKRKNLGIRGREYVEKYHDYKRNALILEKIYKGEYPELKGKEAFSYLNTLNMD